jgi:hypothetical protein
MYAAENLVAPEVTPASEGASAAPLAPASEGAPGLVEVDQAAGAGDATPLTMCTDCTTRYTACIVACEDNTECECGCANTECLCKMAECGTHCTIRQCHP